MGIASLRAGFAASSRPFARARALGALLALALVLVGCGGTQRVERVEQAVRRIEAPVPSVEAYDSTVPPGEPILGSGAFVRDGVDRAARSRSIEVAGDPRLATIASWAEQHVSPEGDPPPAEVLDFFAHHVGLVEPTPHLLILELPATANLARSVEQSVDRFFERRAYTHWGAAVTAHAGRFRVVIALSLRQGTLTATPRRIEVGARLRVRGSLREGISNPLLVTDAPSGAIDRRPAGQGLAIEVEYTPTEPGLHRLQVLGTGAQGPTVVLNVPVYVGVPVPTGIDLAPETDEARTPEAVARQLFRLTNVARARAGIPALELDPRLEAVALAHCRDMQTNHFVAHDSPTTGAVTDRVRAAQLQSGLVLENIAQGRTPREMHEGLESSPGHRANLVNPDANVLGIGVVATESGFLATYVMMRVVGQVDTHAAVSRLLEQMNRARFARGARQLEVEPNLEGAAREAAAAYFADPSLSTQATIDRASSGLRRYAIAFRRVAGVMGVVGSVEEAGQLEPTLADDVTYVGIGVAQGTRPDTEPNAIAVVIMLGWSRAQ